MLFLNCDIFYFFKSKNYYHDYFLSIIQHLSKHNLIYSKTFIDCKEQFCIYSFINGLCNSRNQTFIKAKNFSWI